MKITKQKIRLSVSRVATINGRSVAQPKGTELETTTQEAARMQAAGQCELIGESFEVDAPEITQDVIEETIPPPEPETKPEPGEEPENETPDLDPDGPQPEPVAVEESKDPLARARARKKSKS